MKNKLLAILAVGLLAGPMAAQATIINYFANLGPEAPGATGTGSVSVSFDDVTNIFTFFSSFSGLSGVTTQSHFHCCTAAPFTGTAGIAVDSPSLPIPVGVTAGSFGTSLDLDDISNFNANFLSNSGGTAAGAIARFRAGMDNGQTYLNIHSTAFPGGEIRGFLLRVPEPGTLGLLGLGLLGLGLAGLGFARRRKLN